MYKLKFCFILLFSLIECGSGSSLVSSCTGRFDDPWNSEMVEAFLETWLRSGVTVAVENKVTSMLFHPYGGEFTQHFAHQNDKKVEDWKNEFISLEEIHSSNMLMGFEQALKSYINDKEKNEVYTDEEYLKESAEDDEDYTDEEYKKEHEEDNEDIMHDNYDAGGNDLKHENYEYFNENDRSVVTIGNFADGVPTGIVWQWKSRRFEDGFLYGQVTKEGKFTGEKITYIYPDLRTGITGTFLDGTLIAGTEVKIIGERCNNGIKELKFKTVDKRKEIVWKKENLNATYIGMHPTVRDPFERRGIYIGQSLIPGSGEGIFAKRDFFPGQLVSYLSGLKLTQDGIFPPGLTRHEQEVAGSYYFGFGVAFPGFPREVCIDVPPRYRHVRDYRTTLGHKVNHNLVGTNTEFGFVRHPSHGPVVALVATQHIAKGQELFVSYNYGLENAPQWYKDHHKMVNGS